jgi:rhamnose utilization protein RhaD (predicted bifunctional aldolase and dehydrogenase)
MSASQIVDLIQISRFYGNNKDYIISGGGNTSFKDNQTLYIKASGISLATIEQSGFVALNRKKLQSLMWKTYETEPFEREAQIKSDLMSCRIYPEKGQRPSVESSLHEMIQYPFVVHTHPTLVNAILCSQYAELSLQHLGLENYIYIEYCDPGYSLAKRIVDELENYRRTHNQDPRMIFLGNHGIFVAAETTAEIFQIYDSLLLKIKLKIKDLINITQLDVDKIFQRNIGQIENIFTQIEQSVKYLRIRNNTLISYYIQNQARFDKIAWPFTPDIVVYCKSAPLFLHTFNSFKELLDQLSKSLPTFRQQFGYLPKIVLIQGVGMMAIEDSPNAVEIVLDMYEDEMKIAYYSENFGGPKALNQRERTFIDTWEVENYRRQVAKNNH